MARSRQETRESIERSQNLIDNALASLAINLDPQQGTGSKTEIQKREELKRKRELKDINHNDLYLSISSFFS